jgi:hypothetical protein
MKTLISTLTLILVSIATFAQDMYLEYKMSGTMTATNKIYTSSTAGMRMEMEMDVPRAGKMLNIVIMPKGKPVIYMLNEKSKSYTELPLNYGKTDKDFSIEVVGKEKVAGYNCVHIKVMNDKKQITDMWTTKDIAGYETMNLLSKSNEMFGSEKVYTQLKSKGADGMMVKTVLNLDKKTIVNELVKAEKHSNPASMFALPAGYSKMNVPKY